MCLNSSHGRVPRVETVFLLLQNPLGNGRDPGSSILINLLRQPAWSLQKSDHAGSTEPVDVRHKERPVEELFSSVS